MIDWSTDWLVMAPLTSVWHGRFLVSNYLKPRWGCRAAFLDFSQFTTCNRITKRTRVNQKVLHLRTSDWKTAHFYFSIHHGTWSHMASGFCQSCPRRYRLCIFAEAYENICGLAILLPTLLSMSSAGLIFTRKKDIVRCKYRRQKLRRLSANDHPIERDRVRSACSDFIHYHDYAIYDQACQQFNFHRIVKNPALFNWCEQCMFFFFLVAVFYILRKSS